MSERRVYLYRKAGREVWDAEMWLSDGRRRVWRTGIVGRDAAEDAAWARLKTLEQTPGAVGGNSTVQTGADGGGGDGAQAARPVRRDFVSEMAEPGRATEKRAAVVAADAPAASWGERFDRWFFGELTSLFQ